MAATSLRSVVVWRPDTNLTRDIEAWRHAALVVAPHGAGLANLLFASEGTPVIEVCYDSQTARSPMNCPAMYGAMALNLHLPYWVVTGAGSYTTPMRADISQLQAAARQALRHVYHRRGHAQRRAAACHGGGPARSAHHLHQLGGRANSKHSEGVGEVK